MPKFSIIIPAHNDEERISKALDSVKDQTFTDYELIVICDACTDNTEHIAKRYGAITRCVDYHRDGLSRNAGLDIAKGEWVLFMDSDDWWLHEFVLAELDRVTKGYTPFDILVFMFIWRGVGVAGVYQEHGALYPNVWSKLWRRSTIGSTRFSDAWSVSDLDFMRRMLEKNPVIAAFPMPLYYYNYMREGSITETDKRRKEHDK